MNARLRTIPLIVAALTLTVAGCRKAPDDAALNTAVQQQLASDTLLTGQSISPSVQAGIVTLTGTVANDTQRTVAARDAAGVSGVRQVINGITVATVIPDQSAPVAAPLPAPAPAPEPTRRSKPQASVPLRQSAPIERTQPQQAYNPPPPPPPPQASRTAAPPPPSYRTVNIPAGTTLPIRVTQTLDSATTQQGTPFSGVLASDIVINGLTAIPAGTHVSGNVDAVQEAAHFKGSSLLTVSLTSVNLRGDHVAITSDPYTVEGKGRGKNTAIKTGGGAAVGAILGGIFGGGKGAAIGAAAGGGVGAGSNAITRGEQVQIPSETIVRFSLTTPIRTTVRDDGGVDAPAGLQHRPSNP